MLRSLLAEGDIGVAEPESLGGLPSGDLFAVANAIAALLDAPITIEDRSSLVLAFSGRQDEADPARVEVMLGRQVPSRFMRVLRGWRCRVGRRLGRLEDLQGEALILELRDLAAARGDEPTGAMARLIDYDRRHRTNLVETLRAWLDAFGDVVAAADAMFVHQNTFRYRLRRVAEVGGIDLADPDQRFAAMLLLRVLG